MKKTFTKFLAALALLAFFIPSMTAWADTAGFTLASTTTVPLAANASPQTTTITGSQSETWNVAISGTWTSSSMQGSAGSKYWQMGANGKAITSATFSTSGISGTITSIVVNCASYQQKAKVNCTVDGSDFGTQNQTTSAWSNNAGSNITFTGSNSGTIVVTIDNSASGAKAVYIQSITVTYTAGGSTAVATTTTIDAAGITNTDIKNGTAAGSLSATVKDNNNTTISGASVTWSGDNDAVATIDANTGVVTLVGDGTVTFTASYEGESGQYNPSSDTYEMTVTDTRYSISDLTFTSACGGSGTADDGAEWTVTSDGTESNFDSTSGIHYGTNSASVTYLQLATSDINGTIKKVVVNTRDAQATASVTVTVGGTSFYCGENTSVTATNTSTDYTFTGTGTGEIVVRIDRGESMTKAIYVKSVKVYYIPSTDPVIVANDPAELDYDATSGEIVYSITNPATGVNLSATSNAAWITNVAVDGINSKVTFSTSANENTTQRNGTITLSYTGATDKVITITQAGAPVIFSTIPDIFNAATSTSTDVNVTFGNWVVSGVSGSNAFVTDNNGNGFIIYKSDHGFAVNNKLSGTVMETPLKLYKGSAEFTNLTTATEGLTVSNDGTITVITNKTIADLSGVNTGSVITLSNLSYDGTNLSDGTNNIKPYSTLYSDMSFTSGKTYNVTGVYQQFDNTKEILPRSADDIEEVVVTVPTIIIASSTVNATAASASGTITVEYENFSTINASVWFCNAAGTTETSYNWLTATINASNNVDYTIQSNSSEARTAYFKVKSGDTYSNIVTINQAEYVDPNTGTITFGNNGVNITSASTESGGQKANDNLGNEWTITATGTTSFSQSTNYSQVGKSAEPATSITFTTTLPQTVKITDFSAKFGGFNGTAGAVTLKVGDNTVGTGSLNATNDVIVSASTTNTKGTTLTVTVTDIDKGVKCYYISYTAIPVYTLDITGYGNDQTVKNGWYLIASPVDYTLAGQDMVSGTDYDLYRFNPNADLEWENYKNTEHSDFTTLEVGRGYLYANANDITLSFTGVPTSTGAVTAAYTGWNLVGNPLGTAATVDREYYRMNDTHTGIMTDASTSNVAVMEGIFVQTTENTKTVTFTAANGGSKSNNIESVILNIVDNDNVIDRAIVRFNSDRQLGKLTLFDNDTKIYIPQNDGDYAIVSSNGQGTMPVNFKAKEMGMYTISVETEGIDLGYLHLIDRLTGDDVNLLLDSKYSFIASNSDMESRFILSFDENNINASNETFAFQSGSDIIVNGEGELQIFDVMGRNIMNTMINGVQTVNVKSNGVYIFKLNEKTQKIIVR